ncbi:hypothetical protein HYR54_08255 [Candidatus Acetothermia bacterium]|nr:hypothetical protein [Candidatus Acetothermia bacterium]MBI3459449.1 hypothetical protein [Candidatus Acetothermia bacterium]
MGQTKHTGRRIYLFIPKEGLPHLLAHFLDKGPFEKMPYERELYTSWVEMRASLQELLGNCSRVAMEYSPGATLHALGKRGPMVTTPIQDEIITLG